MKINLGFEGHSRKPFNWSHDISTTNAFGICQPILTKEVPAKTSINLRVGSIARLMPLVKPTFGSAELKTYCGFVPYEEIYHPFASLLAQKPYQGVSNAYIPKRAPFLTYSDLKYILLHFAYVSVYEIEGYYPDTDSITYDSSSLVTDSQTAREVIEDTFDNLRMYQPEHQDTALEYMHQQFASRGSTYTILYDDSINIESADFVLFENYQTGSYAVCFTLKESGRIIRNLILGCGGQISDSSLRFNLMNAIAHYKFYFDSLKPQRELTWKQTVVYGMVEYMEQMGFSTLDNSDLKLCRLIADAFVFEFSDMYYYTGTDFISAHITGTAISDDSTSFASMNKVGTMQTTTASKNQVPGIGQAPLASVTQVGLNVLRQLTSFVNKNTILGGKIREFMRVHYGAEYLDEHESYKIGESRTPISFSDVMSMSDTLSADGATGSVIGEYAGKGYGEAGGEKFHFETKAHGVVVAFQVVVPRGRWSQGIDPNTHHTERFDFYTPQFDAITLKPNSANILFGCNDVNALSEMHDYDNGFGNIPLYTEYKVAPNRLLGEMSLRSTRASYLPFTLDKLLPYDDFKPNGPTGGNIFFINPQTLVNSVEWRSVGRDKSVGNFDRIFENSGYETLIHPSRRYLDTMNDNFIIHNYVDFVGMAPMVPVDSSFDTEAFEQSMSVEKA